MLRVRATRVGREAILSQIIKTVKEPQYRKLQIELFFLPAVLTIALISFIAGTSSMDRY